MSDLVRVLIVDDAEESRQVLRSALAFDESIQVVGEAASGREAMDLSGSRHPDVVLMDVRMPDVDGIEATRDILGRHPWIRILALTAYEDHASVRDMLAAGAIGYLVKGARVDDVVAAIHKAGEGEAQLDERVVPHVLDDLRSLLAKERDRRAEAERMARVRENFVQVLSHELRTPLTVIGGTLRFLDERELDEDAATLTASALRRVEDLERLVEGLELVGDPPDRASVAVPRQSIRQAISEVGQEPDDVDVDVDPWPGVPPRHLTRVTWELLSNAFGHGARPVRLRAGLERRVGVLRVTDAGDLDPDPELLAAFTQADMTTQRARGGLGLGLYVASRLCESLGGDVQLRREAGTTVAEARFPLDER
jgi:DNA-binding NarL/FixJ family response regulator